MDNTQHTTNLPLSAIGALALGQKIQAIKIVRTETSLGLKEAKELVEAYEKEHPDIRQHPVIDKNSSSLGWLWLTAVLLIMGAVSWRLLVAH